MEEKLLRKFYTVSKVGRKKKHGKVLICKENNNSYSVKTAE